MASAEFEALRDAGDALPGCFVGLTLWFDSAQTGDSAVKPRGVDPDMEAAWIRTRFETYAGEGGDLRDPRVSPLEANLSGLPPSIWASDRSTPRATTRRAWLRTAAAMAWRSRSTLRRR